MSYKSQLSKSEREKANIKKGKSGEKLVNKCLKMLNLDVKLLNNVYITDNIKTSQIDHIIISKRALIHIETKTWAGKHKLSTSNSFEEDNSYLKFSNPAYQANIHELMLNRYLNTLKGFKDIRYKGLIVQADIHGSIKSDEDNNIPILKPEDLVEYINDYIYNSNDTECLTSEQVKNIYFSLFFHSLKNKIIKSLEYISDVVLRGLRYIAESLTDIISTIKDYFSIKKFIIAIIVILIGLYLYTNLYMYRVSDNMWLYSKSLSGKFLKNRAYNSHNFISFGNKKYDNGISTLVQNNDSTSMTLRLKYNGINLNRKVFECLASVDNGSVWDENSQAKVQVLNGKNVIYDSGFIAPWKDPAEIKVDVDGLDEITLVFHYENPTPSQICIAIAEPVLY